MARSKNAARKADAVPRLTIVAWPGLDVEALLGDEFVASRPKRTAIQSGSLDTTDHRLARAGVVVDRVGEDWVVRCGAHGVRTFPGDGEAPPKQLTDGLVGIARGESLVPIVRVRRAGRSRTVQEAQRDEDGNRREVGELLDEDVSVLDGRRVVFRQRYIVAEGDARFVEHTRLRLSALGMSDRVVGSFTEHVVLGPPDPMPWPLEDEPLARTVIQRTLARSVARLLAHDPVVRFDLHVEGVHQMRVATRRLRSDMRTFRDLLVPSDLSDELRWLAEVLGAVRDPDVLATRLEEAVSHLESADQRAGLALLRRLSKERDEALAKLHEALETDRYAKLVARLVDYAERPPFLDEAAHPATEMLVPLARRAFQRLRKAARVALEPDATTDQVHETRIRAKRFRYAVDALSEILPEAEAHAERLADLQDVLGDFNDAVVAEAWLRDVSNHEKDPNRMFVLGQLVMTQRVLVEKGLADWPAAWRPVRRHRRRAWLNR